MDRVPDIQFLQRMGIALFLMALVAGSVTVFGAATSHDHNADLWPVWQLAEACCGRQKTAHPHGSIYFIGGEPERHDRVRY